MKNWNVEIKKLVDLVPLEDNPRKIEPANARALKASIERFGVVELIVWNKRTGHIVSGHQRCAVLKSMGVTEVPVIVVDLDDEEERAAAITMNNFAIEGEFTNPINELLASIREEDSQLYAELRMENLRDDVSKLLDKVDSKSKDMDNKLDKAGDNQEEYDTECPCCGHKWKIGPDDIELITEGEPL